jgi:DNA invertase Pin-like site-specific DNA recombinase
MAQTVRVIPARIMPQSADRKAIIKRRVAGYARVSTDEEEQKTSYAAQVDYYTKYIQTHADWEFVAVYTDEGISGTSTRHREGFQRMVRDAMAGKIDLIVTKSVSRFARNTVDSLTTIRSLKEQGTEVYFEKENIWTFDSKGELLLTIMSSLAQEESRSISENVRWGNRKKFSDGRYSMNYKQLLGYDRGPDGKPVVNLEQAKVVRRIYGLFLTGRRPKTIASILTGEGAETPGGQKKWYPRTVVSILTNETYMGDKLLQKTYSPDFLSKARVKNQGQAPRYYVEQDHEAIIPPKTFRLVQDEILRRKNGPRSGSGIFAGKLFCSECGDFYGRKVWHSNDKYRKVIWRCNGKYKGEKKCGTPAVREEEIKAAFAEVLQQLEREKTEVLSNLQEVLEGGENCRSDARERQIRAFLEVLVQPGEEFSEDSWCVMVDRVTVYSDRYVFTLAGGEKVEVMR